MSRLQRSAGIGFIQYLRRDSKTNKFYTVKEPGAIYKTSWTTKMIYATKISLMLDEVEKTMQMQKALSS